jgi:hypothetical protein
MRSGDIGPHPRKCQQPWGGLRHHLPQGAVELGDLRAESGVTPIRRTTRRIKPMGE